MGKIKLFGAQNKKQAKEKKEKLQSIINKTKKIYQLFSTQQATLLKVNMKILMKKKENVDLDVVTNKIFPQ